MKFHKFRKNSQNWICYHGAISQIKASQIEVIEIQSFGDQFDWSDQIR